MKKMLWKQSSLQIIIMEGFAVCVCECEGIQVEMVRFERVHSLSN